MICKAIITIISILAVAGSIALIDTSEDTQTQNREARRRMNRINKRKRG